MCKVAVLSEKELGSNVSKDHLHSILKSHGFNMNEIIESCSDDYSSKIIFRQKCEKVKQIEAGTVKVKPCRGCAHAKRLHDYRVGVSGKPCHIKGCSCEDYRRMK